MQRVIGGRTSRGGGPGSLKKALEWTSWPGGLARLGGFTGVDLSKDPLDEGFDFEGKRYEIGIHSLMEIFNHLSDTE